MPLHGEVVLSTARLNRIEEVDALGCTLAAGAGVQVADAQRAAAGHGLALGVDLASRESATLGGIVATNAGGIAFVKHGNTRAQVLGLEAVLADGGADPVGGTAQRTTSATTCPVCSPARRGRSR